jgi:hypothetical protein
MRRAFEACLIGNAGYAQTSLPQKRHACFDSDMVDIFGEVETGDLFEDAAQVTWIQKEYF